MPAVREFLQRRPWIGWVVAALIGGFAVWNLTRGGGAAPYSPQWMTEMVTIKFTDTGDEMEIPRGRLDRMLRGRGDVLDPSQGIVNPQTGQPTGFPFDKKEWESMISRINTERAAVRKEFGDRAKRKTASDD